MDNTQYKVRYADARRDTRDAGTPLQCYHNGVRSEQGMSMCGVAAIVSQERLPDLLSVCLQLFHTRLKPL